MYVYRLGQCCLELHSGNASGGQIGHFRVARSLCFKVRLSAKPLMIFSLLQIKLGIFRRKVLHLASFCKQGISELGNDLFEVSDPLMQNVRLAVTCLVLTIRLREKRFGRLSY